MHCWRFGGFAAFTMMVTALPVGAQVHPCSDGVFRQFDFWVGEWTVSNSQGAVIAHSTIQRTANDCAITEHWRPVNGPDGVSISWYATTDSMWHQQWVGGGGWIERMAGGFRDGTMTMIATESAMLPGSSVPASAAPQAGKYRTNWALQPDGSVKQWGEATTDGATWTPAFVGIYRRTG